MPYTTYPLQPRIRRDAVRLVCYRGWSIRKVARHIGVQPSTVSRWVKLDPTGGWQNIPTQSSRPHHHPYALSSDIVHRILCFRAERNQCAEIIHHRLKNEGVVVSVSSVKRTLRRHSISRFSRWKKWHVYPPRPIPEKPGILVQIDTMQDGIPADHLYCYALIDVCSRWGDAVSVGRINTYASLRFVEHSQGNAPFSFHTMQSDHGSEFSKWLTNRLQERGLAHRHSRVRTPTDNGHIERFIQTLQKECFARIPRSLDAWRHALPDYLRYYNTERPHMGLHMRTPLEVLRSYWLENIPSKGKRL